MILPSSDGAGTAADGRVLGRPAKAGLSADGEMTKEWTYELNLNNDRMKLKFLWVIVFTSTVLVCGAKESGRRIFVYGGEVEPKFVEYVCGLIGKADPRICYLPTASGDNDDNIRHWEFICKTLGIEPHVMRVWIDSETQRQSFEDLLLGMDAIVVGGGNTLNMMGIWKYQEIDAALRKAYERGIVLSGGSAGSLCWFAGGVSDSRPCNLSVVEGLGLLPFSHCPHYDVAAKRTFYDDLVVRRKLPAGYACEDHAGILFVDGTVADAVSSNHQARSYRVARGRSGLKIDTLESRVLLKKGALDESAYRKESFSGHVGDWMQAPYSMRTPFLAFVSVQRLFADGRYSEYAPYAVSALRERVAGMEDRAVDEEARAAKLSVRICAVLECGDFAAVVSKTSADFYSLWYFVREHEEWKCAGEDIGGASEADAETTFREKAPVVAAANGLTESDGRFRYVSSGR